MRLIFFALSLAQLILGALVSRRSLFERRGFRAALVVVLLISGLAWLWFGARDLVAFETAELGSPVPTLPVDDQLAGQGILLGVAQGGELWIVAPAASAGATARLTQIGMAESVSPDSREIELRPYEGMALVIRGHDGGGWIYEAEIVEQGGPLLTSLVRQAYHTEP